MLNLAPNDLKFINFPRSTIRDDFIPYKIFINEVKLTCSKETQLTDNLAWFVFFSEPKTNNKGKTIFQKYSDSTYVCLLLKKYNLTASCRCGKLKKMTLRANVFVNNRMLAKFQCFSYSCDRQNICHNISSSLIF